MTRTRAYLVLFFAGAALLAAAVWGPCLAFHVLPPRWTGEAERLARVLEISSDSVVADIGAGDGEMAVEIGRTVGPSGLVYATELGEQQRAAIARAAKSKGAAAVRVVAAEERATGLPPACCDAMYMRNVLHHIADRAAYAKELRKALKPGGRVAIIDFSPATFFHLAGDHGVAPQDVIATMTAAGFRLERRVDDWGGRLYLVVFRG